MDPFPAFEIPHETTVYKEVHMPNALYLAQPVGKLSYIWFTTNTCYLNDLTKMYKIVTAFDPILAKENGTVLQGTYMYYESQPCFVIHNLIYYKGEKIESDYFHKYELMQELLANYVWNEKVTKFQCMFFLPIISYRLQSMDTCYPIHCIKIIELHGTKIINYIDKSVLKVFHIKPTDICDIYELYDVNKFHSIAHVDTFERSIFLNQLFKQKTTIDSIEESDDDTECILIPIKVQCKWNETFKKWTPIKSVN
jgi:hypothetical protein